MEQNGEKNSGCATGEVEIEIANPSSTGIANPSSKVHSGDSRNRLVGEQNLMEVQATQSTLNSERVDIDPSLFDLNPLSDYAGLVQGIVLNKDNCIPIDHGGAMGLQQVMESGMGEQHKQVEESAAEQIFEGPRVTQEASKKYGRMPGEQEIEAMWYKLVIEGRDSMPALQQMTDVEDSCQWNPVKDSSKRIGKKLAHIERYRLLEDQPYKELNDSYGELSNCILPILTTTMVLV